jgi:transcriptional antiterminator NusG
VVKVSHDPESHDGALPDPALDSPPAIDSDSALDSPVSDEMPAESPLSDSDDELDADLEEDVLEEDILGDDDSADDDDSVEEADADEDSVEDAAEEGDASGAGAVSAAEVPEEEENVKRWYILKVQVNREESIRRALERRVKVAGLDRFFGEIVVPTEDVAEYNKSGKRRIVKRKLYPGYLMIHLALNDDTWFLVRETPGIGDFTGSAGKPTPMADHEVQRIVMTSRGKEAGDTPVKTTIPFKHGDRVRVKEGYFENFEGDVESIDEANGRVTVMINIFGRSVPVELEHWQMESV